MDTVSVIIPAYNEAGSIIDVLERVKDQKIDATISKPGDLHFFGKNDKISHVGISTGGHNILHCQGWVKEESFSESKKKINVSLADMYMHTCSVELNLNT